MTVALEIPLSLQKVPMQLRIQHAEKGRKEIRGKMVVTCQEEESVSVHRKHLRGFSEVKVNSMLTDPVLQARAVEGNRWLRMVEGLMRLLQTSYCQERFVS
jgi:hypothetical protein